MDGHAPPPPPPPPPPPHGANPKSTGGSGLPPGNYDIFIIPPHSSGSGFLYLPSLRPQLNSFIAGAASAFFAVWLWTKMSPILKSFVHTVNQSGAGVGMLILVGIVGAGAFYVGNVNQPGFGGAGSGPDANGHGGAAGAGAGAGGASAGGPPPQPQPNGYASGAPPNGHAGGPGGQQHWGPQGAQYGHQQHYANTPPPQPPPQEAPPPPPPPPPPRTEPYGARSEADSSERPQPRPRSYSNASASWQKAKEETRKREEERKKEAEAKAKAEADAKAKAEADRKARAAEEKIRWEKQRAREKEERERKERERLARERLDAAKAEAEKARLEKEIKEKMEKEKQDREARIAKEKAERVAREARERLEKAKADAAAAAAAASSAAKSESGKTFGVGERTNPYSLDPNDKSPTPAARYQKPSAQSYAGTSTAESYRPYDKHKHGGSAASSVYSESYASTAPSTAPPSHRGPYSTTDPAKVVIKAVYQFSSSFPKPEKALVAGQDGVTDGLILRFATEGMFVDDDVRGSGLREWDIKTWTMKSVEAVSLVAKGLYILRVTIKSPDAKNYVFIMGAPEEWKAKKGANTLQGGALASKHLIHAMPGTEATRLLTLLGWQ